MSGTVTIHNTPSDNRALANVIADLRKIGLKHPLDFRREEASEYPAHVHLPVTERTQRKVREFLYEKGWPLKVQTSELRDVVTHTTAEKSLYKIGYRIGGKKGQSNVWVANEEITGWHEELLKNHPVNSTPDVEVKLREDAFDAPPVPEVEVKQTIDLMRDLDVPDDEARKARVVAGESEEQPAEHVDFIDDRDSWAVPMEELFSSVALNIMDEQLRILRAIGMEYEMRVWRKK